MGQTNDGGGAAMGNAEARASRPAASDEMTAALNAALEAGDLNSIMGVMGEMARAHRMRRVARETGLGEKSLYKSMRAGANPEFNTVLRVLRSLGFQLQVNPVASLDERAIGGIGQQRTIKYAQPNQEVIRDMASSNFEDIRITGIITERVTEPRNDGTEGSALYSIPFSLSRRPEAEWSRLFSQKWDRPAQFTTMHRPGIARVHGDTIVLNGTTMEEVENIHLKTLQSAVAETNKAYRELRGKQDELRAREETTTQEHRKRVEEVAKRLNFD